MKPCCLAVSLLLILSMPWSAHSQAAASFTAPSTVCLNTPVSVTNTSTGASSYYWSFCAADFNSTPQADNIGNPGGLLNEPVFICYAQDDDGNFYGLVDDHIIGHMIRLSFGTSLLNTPTAEDLGGFGNALPSQLEGIQLERVNGNWTAIVVGGGNSLPNSDPRIAKVDFGKSLKNTPTATNWGNIGNLSLPIKLFVTYENGHFYGFTGNTTGATPGPYDYTVTRFDFGPDFTNPPTGVNLGNFGGQLNYPSGLSFADIGGNWYCFICNSLSNSILRLDFGNSLLNTPTTTNLGNTGYLNTPRDIALLQTCSGLHGLLTNAIDNTIVRLDFPNGPTSTPTDTQLGNIGELSFPHSLSNLFMVGSDIYTFVPNVNNNTMTRFRLAGCSDVPASTQQNPAPITYPQPGVYNINLMADLGLPDQSSYCRTVTVFANPQGKLVGDTVCAGNNPQLFFTGVAGTAPFTIGYTSASANYTQASLTDASGFPLPYPLTAGSADFTLTSITDANGCQSDTTATTEAMIDPLPQGGITGSSICGADSASLIFTASNGVAPFNLQLTGETATGIASGIAFDEPLSGSPTVYTLNTITDAIGCTRTAGFDNPTVSVMPRPYPVLQFDVPATICVNAGIQMLQGEETSGLPGTGSFSGPALWPNGRFYPAGAGVGPHELYYTYAATNGCTKIDSSRIIVEPLPAVASDMLEGCDGIPVQLDLEVAGGATYDWTPATGLSDAHIHNPVASPDVTTVYTIQVVDSNGCSATDTLTLREMASIKSAFMVPNAFTPNGDGHNDCFGIREWGDVKLRELDVFNRWGQRVFSTTSPTDCWDGTVDGQPQPPGAYVFVIKADTPCGKITRTGSLMLIR